MKGHLTQAEAKLHWQSKDIHTEKRVVKKKKVVKYTYKGNWYQMLLSVLLHL